MSKNRLYISTGAFHGNNLAVILEQALAAGITQIELSSGLPYQPDILEVVRTYHSQITYLIHNYFPAPSQPFVLNLAAVDQAVLKRSRAHCYRAIDLSSKFEIPIFSVHAGFAYQPRVEQLGQPFIGGKTESRERAYTIFGESVENLVEYGQQRGVRLLIENNVVAPFNAPSGQNDKLLLAEAEEMVRFAKTINSPWFGYLIDFGHLQVTAQTLGFDRVKFLNAVSPWVGALHLSHNNGMADTNEPFDKQAWFLPYLRRWPNVPVVIEAYKLTPAQFKQCLESVKLFLSSN